MSVFDPLFESENITSFDMANSMRMRIRRDMHSSHNNMHAVCTYSMYLYRHRLIHNYRYNMYICILWYDTYFLIIHTFVSCVLVYLSFCLTKGDALSPGGKAGSSRQYRQTKVYYNGEAEDYYGRRQGQQPSNSRRKFI
jgi:hypothetical protein